MAAKYCSGLFSTTLLQARRFFPCVDDCGIRRLHSQLTAEPDDQPGTIWAAKYCSGLFSTTLLQAIGVFLQCIQ
jgi:hypothetical protein